MDWLCRKIERGGLWNAINCFCTGFFGDVSRFINLVLRSSGREISSQNCNQVNFWDVLVWKSQNHAIQPKRNGDHLQGTMGDHYSVERCQYMWISKTLYGWYRCIWAKNEEGRIHGLIVGGGEWKAFLLPKTHWQCHWELLALENYFW